MVLSTCLINNSYVINTINFEIKLNKKILKLNLIYVYKKIGMLIFFAPNYLFVELIFSKIMCHADLNDFP